MLCCILHIVVPTASSTGIQYKYNNFVKFTLNFELIYFPYF